MLVSVSVSVENRRSDDLYTGAHNDQCVHVLTSLIFLYFSPRTTLGTTVPARAREVRMCQTGFSGFRAAWTCGCVIHECWKRFQSVGPYVRSLRCCSRITVGSVCGQELGGYKNTLIWALRSRDASVLPAPCPSSAFTATRCRRLCWKST